MFFDTARSKQELIGRLKAIHPDLQWFIVPDSEPMVAAQYGGLPHDFLILCRKSSQSVPRRGLLAFVRCEGKSYFEAEDKDKWVKAAAREAVSQLPKS